MRSVKFLSLIIIAFLAAATARAQEGTQNYGTITCPQPVSCDATTADQIAAIVAIGNGCVRQFFGYSSPGGFFEEAAGLDAASCLTPKPGTVPQGTGAVQLGLHCCEIKRPDSSCALRCELNGAQ